MEQAVIDVSAFVSERHTYKKMGLHRENFQHGRIAHAVKAVIATLGAQPRSTTSQ